MALYRSPETPVQVPTHPYLPQYRSTEEKDELLVTVVEKRLLEAFFRISLMLNGCVLAAVCSSPSMLGSTTRPDLSQLFVRDQPP